MHFPVSLSDSFRIAARRTLFSLACCLVPLTASIAQEQSTTPEPIRVLLVAGGCCHDYETQTKLLKNGLEKRLNVEVTVEFNPSKGTDTVFEVYDSDDWAKPYDCIIHDECSARVMDKVYVGRILAAHKSGIPAVNLHCAMHSYRWGDYTQPVQLGAENAGWYEMIGVQSTRHGPKTPIEVTYSSHPITKGLANWKTIDEELYNNVRVFDGTTVLASGIQQQPPGRRELRANPDAKPRQAEAVVAWTNEYGPKKTRIFSTSLGHNNETVGDAKYLDFVSRGLLWATGHLDASGKPDKSYVR